MAKQHVPNQAFLNFPFTLKHPGCNTSLPSFQKHSSIPFQAATFLGIKPQASSASSTLSLSGTFCNNSHVMSVGIILPAKSLEMLKKSFGAFQAGLFSAELLGFSFQDQEWLFFFAQLLLWSHEMTDRSPMLFRGASFCSEGHKKMLCPEAIAEHKKLHTDCSH